MVYTYWLLSAEGSVVAALANRNGAPSSTEVRGPNFDLYEVLRSLLRMHAAVTVLLKNVDTVERKYESTGGM